jgi:hypothetical protein
MTGVSALMHEVTSDKQIFIRPVQAGAFSEFELVVRPTTTVNALDFFIENSDSSIHVVLSDAISSWTSDTSTPSGNSFGFAGFGAIDESQTILPDQETVIARITAAGDSAKEFEIHLRDVSLGNEVLTDQSFTLDRATIENGSVTFTPEDDSSVWIDGFLSYSRASRAINAQDALEAFRLALNQSTTSGSRTAEDYISADFDRNGSVSTNDALEILSYALRRPNYDAEWVFVDAEADLSRVGRRSSSYDTGKTLTEMNPAESAILIGILLGDVNDSFNY